MPTFNADLLFDTAGRKIGSDPRRPDIFARDINFTGTLSGTGLQSWIINNPTADVSTVDVQSNTGIGGVQRRFRVRNDSGFSYVIAEFLNAIVTLGSNLLMVPARAYSGPTDTDNYFTWYRQGSTTIPALLVSPNGELQSYAFGYQPWILRGFAWGDAQPQFGITSSGALQWGPGGSAAMDVGIARTAGGRIAILNVSIAGWGSVDLFQAYFHSPPGVPPFTVDSSTKVSGLNADLLDGADWGSPLPIGDSNPTTGAFTTISASQQIHANQPTGTPPFGVLSTTVVPNLTVGLAQDLQMNGIVNPHGSAFKHKRVTTGSVSAGARLVVVIPWYEAFTSTNYAVSVAVFDSLNPTIAGLSVERIVAQELDHISVQVYNTDSVAHTGTLHAIGIKEF